MHPAGTPHFPSRFSIASVGVPSMTMPLRSLLISLRNTGTPRSEKPSASTFRDTVLPVPVAPAIRPWRFAMEGSRYTGVPFSQDPIQILPS